MTQSGIPWDYRYQYLTGDVTQSLSSGSRWSGWSSPAGQFVTQYINSSVNNGHIPVFTYNTIVQSSPNPGSESLSSKFNNATTMAAYFEDWVLLMTRAAASGQPVIVHHEPDAWGWMQQQSSNPASTYVAVADTGLAELSGFANNGAGFAEALVALRDQIAPNVILAWHASHWAGGADFTTLNGTSNQAIDSGHSVAAFYNALGVDFDLIFTDPSDRDWGYLVTSQGQSNAVWDDASFDRFRQFVSILHEDTGVSQMLWQLPLGNTIYRTMDNTNGHYQDNQVEYFLQDGTVQHIEDYIGAGVIGLLFGRGDGAQTTYLDGKSDGITNPAPVNGNDEISVWSDDDGGLLRIRGANYYDDGPVALPVCAP